MPESPWQSRFDSLNDPFRACWRLLARPCSFPENRANRSPFLVDHSAWIVHGERKTSPGLRKTNWRSPASSRTSSPVQDCRCQAASFVETASLNLLHRRVKTGFCNPLPGLAAAADSVRTSTPRSGGRKASRREGRLPKCRRARRVEETNVSRPAGGTIGATRRFCSNRPPTGKSLLWNERQKKRRSSR